MSDGQAGRFVKMIARSYKSAATAEQVQLALYKNFDMLTKLFSYYSFLATSERGRLTMTKNEWNQFLLDAKILDKSSGRCRKADADNVFVAANRILGVDTVLQHGKSEDQLVSLRDRRTLAVKYDLHGLHRFQFVAALIQLGIYKYKNSSRSCRIHTKSMDPSVADAFEMLCSLVKKNIEIHRPEAFIIPNDFRARLYTKDMDALCKHKTEFLKTIFEYYSTFKLNPATATTNLLFVDGWLRLLEEGQMFGNASGFSHRDAILCFCWSRMVVTDEICRPANNCSLAFVDFLEALGRVADLISPPSHEEISETMIEHKQWNPSAVSNGNALFTSSVGCSTKGSGSGTNLTWSYYSVLMRSAGLVKQKYIPRRSSVGFLSNKSRALHEKMSQLLEWLVGGLCSFTGMTSEADLIQKLKTPL
mmetsp:Transcript_162/g.285  ORF Transcript_162/g.285 Transcript_162/m.285 type:complete len:419 (-) Transcript_162:211-1467(-)